MFLHLRGTERDTIINVHRFVTYSTRYSRHIVPKREFSAYNLYCCTAHFDIYKVHTPTNTLCIKLEKV